NSIIIAFRGTQEHSIRNRIEDLFWKQLDLNYPGMPYAMVHHGCYSAYHYTTLRHSMGGALASFCALDLTINHGIEDIQLVTFGQPRIGNAAFSNYFIRHVPHTVRVTHANDIVPHLPPYYSRFQRKTYHHFAREVWLQDIEVESLAYSVEKICDGSGEDPSCSRSVSVNSISDHLKYYDIELLADSLESCKIIMNNSTTQYHVDNSGNMMLSKHHLSTSFVELNSPVL
ncbi:lipase precursor, partial [Musa troglodytarum]